MRKYLIAALVLFAVPASTALAQVPAAAAKELADTNAKINWACHKIAENMSSADTTAIFRELCDLEKQNLELSDKIDALTNLVSRKP